MSFLKFLILFSFTSLAFAITDEKLITNTLKAQEKNEIKCKKLYPLGNWDVKKVKNENYEESIESLECVIDYAKLALVENPKSRQDQKKNSILREKILDYEEILHAINLKFEEKEEKSDNFEEDEIIIEKQVFIKKEDNKKITTEIIVEKKPQNLSEAKEKCSNKGFKEKSIDSLEVYLFEKCLEEAGFKQKVKTPVTSKQAEQIKKQKAAKKLEKKQTKDELARKKKLEKKEKKSSKIENIEELKSPKSSSLNSKSAVQEKFLQEEVKEVQKKPAPETKETELEIVKVKPAPTQNPNVSYTKKTTCKIDANGTKVCMFEPQYKVQGTKPINDL